MTIIVTGAAGFIGMHVCERLLARGERVIGVDNFNAYYDPSLKEDRAARLGRLSGFDLARIDIADHRAFEMLAHQAAPNRVVHLAAQAGVRYSLENPFAYERSNLAGHLSVLEACRRTQSVHHLVYASSSSVYGDRALGPTGFSEDDVLDDPASLYAATKRSAELMSATYARLYGMAQTGLRFFTVYGPWGRPDMALFMFARNILEGKPIDVFNNGHHKRDFTFVEDIAEGVVRVLERVAQPDPNWKSDAPDPSSSNAPWRIYNIGNHSPVPLMHYIEVLENCLGRKAQKNFLPLQLGDVPDTFADIDDLVRDVGYRPATPVEVGVRRFVDWFCEYYGYKR